MSQKIAVAYLERPKMVRRWCRARHKTTPTYADSVHTLCGFTICAPCGFETDLSVVDCPECLARMPAPSTRAGP